MNTDPKTKNNSPKIKENSWKFYLDSEDAWTAMLDSMNNALSSIDIEQYIFQNDAVGSKFLEILIKKSQNGIKVRVLLDEVGSFAFSNSKELEDILKNNPNLEIKFFNPLLPWKPHRETFWYFRDHRKLMIIDRKIGFTGSVCLADEIRKWRESHVEIYDTNTINDMVESFDVMWNKGYHKFRYIFRRNKKNDTDKTFKFRYVTNTPLPKKRYLYYELLKNIKNAKKYIYITTPYFLPNNKILKELKKASKRKVDICLLLPHQTDHKIVQIGSETFFEDLLKNNISIFLYDKMIHSKTIVIDDTWSSIGSLNIDNVSLRYNFEGNLVSTDTLFSTEIKDQFINDLKKSSRLELSKWLERSIVRKILEMLVWPFRKLL